MRPSLTEGNTLPHAAASQRCKETSSGPRQQVAYPVTCAAETTSNSQPHHQSLRLLPQPSSTHTSRVIPVLKHDTNRPPTHDIRSAKPQHTVPPRSRGYGAHISRQRGVRRGTAAIHPILNPTSPRLIRPGAKLPSHTVIELSPRPSKAKIEKTTRPLGPPNIFRYSVKVTNTLSAQQCASPGTFPSNSPRNSEPCLAKHPAQSSMTRIQCRCKNHSPHKHAWQPSSIDRARSFREALRLHCLPGQTSTARILLLAHTSLPLRRHTSID